MAEGTSLLRMHTAYTCIVSSNLTVSAKKQIEKPPSGGFFIWCLSERAKRLRASRVRFEDSRVLARGSVESPICHCARGRREAPAPQARMRVADFSTQQQLHMARLRVPVGRSCKPEPATAMLSHLPRHLREFGA